ncbi:hypothetical protein H8959_007487 [Pygathrix nigripes]
MDWPLHAKVGRRAAASNHSFPPRGLGALFLLKAANTRLSKDCMSQGHQAKAKAQTEAAAAKVEGDVAAQIRPLSLAPHPAADMHRVRSSWEREAPLTSSGQFPCHGPGHSWTERQWLGPIVLAEQLEEKRSRKEGETKRQRERERKKQRCSGDAADASRNLHLVKMII